MAKKGFIVAVDGPAGSGKSTVSQRLAKALKGKLLDTGSTYRCVGYFALQKKAKTPREFSRIAHTLNFSWDKSGFELLVNKKMLGKKLRTQEVSHMASYISQFPSVRKTITAKQRELGERGSRTAPIVVEGRDVGTVVFPKTPYKFFVTADPKERAKRRYLQLKAMGEKGVALKLILQQQRQRDNRDSTRKVAPLKPAKDAIIVDTSEMSITQVVAYIKKQIYKPQ